MPSFEEAWRNDTADEGALAPERAKAVFAVPSTVVVLVVSAVAFYVAKLQQAGWRRFKKSRDAASSRAPPPQRPRVTRAKRAPREPF